MAQQPARAVTVVDGRGQARLRYIDALRALAALLVVWLHVSEVFAQVLAAEGGRVLATVARTLDFGRVGVVVFFLISGFVIPPSLRTTRAGPLGRFFCKRLLRIYPAYWLSIIPSAAAAWWLWGRHFGAGEILVNATLLQDVFGVPAASGVYWTLLVELVFYAACMLLAWRGRLEHPGWIAALAGGLAGLHVAIGFVFWSNGWQGTVWALMPLHLALMFTGALWRHVFHAPAVARGAALHLAILAGFFLLAFPLGMYLVVGSPWNYALSTALGTAVFMLGARWLRIETRLTDWLGKVSYSIYLFHMPVFYPLAWWVAQQPADSWWRKLHLGVYMAASLALTLVVAEFVHRWVERPGMAFGRRAADAWSAHVARRNAGPGRSA